MPITTVVFIVISSLITFGFIATMRYLAIYREEKLGSGQTDNSLGAGELRGMIQESMMDAIEPIEKRLDKMEAALKQLPEHRPGAVEDGSE